MAQTSSDQSPEEAKGVQAQARAEAPATAADESPAPTALRRQRWKLLREITAMAEIPMMVLSFIWLILIIIDLSQGLPRPLLIVNYVIWGVFILHFLIELAIAPSWAVYLRHHWITAIALVVPAFRVLRIFRALRTLRLLRAARSINLVRVVTSLNRGIRAMRRVLQRRGVGYVTLLTLIVTFTGAAGMLNFESPASLAAAGLTSEVERGAGLDSYGEALWWTAMIMTTMGTEYWPLTTEGRVLCVLLALYAFGVFGYITATIASVFVGRDLQRVQHSMK